MQCVEVDPETGKTVAVDLQFLPYNKRSANQITPLVVQRMKVINQLYNSILIKFMFRRVE